MVVSRDLSQQLEHAISSRRLAPVSLLVGSGEEDKFSAALKAAQILVCDEERGCSVCGPCKRITARSSESLLVLAPSTTQLKVEDLSPLRPFISLQQWGRARVVIIRQAETLNPTTANMLLKTLEEPPPSTYFFLICPTRDHVLSTIKSRSQVFRNVPGAPREERWFSALTRLRPDLAQRLLAEEGDDFARRCVQLLVDCAKSDRFRAWPEIRLIADSRESARDVLAVWGHAFSSLLHRRWRGAHELKIVNTEFQNLEEALGAGPKSSTQDGLSIKCVLGLQYCLDAESAVQAQVDRTLVLEDTWLRLQELLKGKPHAMA